MGFCLSKGLLEEELVCGLGSIIGLLVLLESFFGSELEAGIVFTLVSAFETGVFFFFGFMQ